MKSNDPLTIKYCALENFGKRFPTLLTITSGYVPECSGSMNLAIGKIIAIIIIAKNIPYEIL